MQVTGVGGVGWCWRSATALRTVCGLGVDCAGGLDRGQGHCVSASCMALDSCGTNRCRSQLWPKRTNEMPGQHRSPPDKRRLPSWRLPTAATLAEELRGIRSDAFCACQNLDAPAPPDRVLEINRVVQDANSIEHRLNLRMRRERTSTRTDQRITKRRGPPTQDPPAGSDRSH